MKTEEGLFLSTENTSREGEVSWERLAERKEHININTLGEKACVTEGFALGPFKLHWAEEHLLTDEGPYLEEIESFTDREVNLSFLGLMPGIAAQ